MSLEMIILHASLIKTTLAAFVAGFSFGTAAIISALILTTDTIGLATALFSAFSNRLGIDVTIKTYFGFIPKLNWEAK